MFIYQDDKNCCRKTWKIYGVVRSSQKPKRKRAYLFTVMNNFASLHHLVQPSSFYLKDE